MGLINGISMYSLQGAKIRKEQKSRLGVEEQTQTTTESKTQTQTKEVKADDVFGYMANQSLSMRVDVQKTIKVCKFANSEQYQRIGDMMKEFEAEIESGLQTLQEDFPNLNISDKAKMKLVLNSMELL